MEKTIKSVYVGRDKVCRCGCKGDYSEPGDPKFDKRVKRFLKMWESYTPSELDIDESYKNISFGNDRAITIYFD